LNTEISLREYPVTTPGNALLYSAPDRKTNTVGITNTNAPMTSNSTSVLPRHWDGRVEGSLD
jgi:hypothetical protein